MADQDYLINFTATGDATAAAAARNVSQAVGDVGEKAASSGGGFGSFTSSVVSFAGKAAVAGAAIKAISTGLEEIAETEGAEQALRKAGVAAESLATAMQAVDDIELFTGDKVTAAQLYGNVMNGRTRELKAYGIALAENATMEEKLEVVEQLRRRGMDLDAAKIGTLSGEWARLKRGMGNALETGVQWIVNSTGLTNALGFVNANILGMNQELPKLDANTKKVAVSFKAAAADVSNMGAAVQNGLQQIRALRGEIGKGADDVEKRIAAAGIDKAEAEGAITPAEAQRRRAQAEFDQAERARQSAANDAERVKARVQQERERLGGVTKESIAAEAEQNLRDSGVTDLVEIQKKVAEEVKKRLEEKSKALLELDEAENAALRELTKRNGERRAAQAELDAKLAQADKAEAEAAMQAGREREAEAARNNDAKLKEAEAARKAAEEKQKNLEALGKGLAEANKELEKADAAEKNERDRSGRKKIKAPASPNELAPLPDRTGPATDKLKDTTQEAAKKAETNLKDTTAAVNRNTQAVVAFAQTTQNAFANVDSQLASLENRIKSNL